MSKLAEERLLELMEQQGVEGFYITDPTNVNYISSYTGADSCLFITRGHKYFITDPRYTEQAMKECPEYVMINWRDDYHWSKAGAVAALTEREGIETVGYEQDTMTAGDYLVLREKLHADLVPMSGTVEEIRAHKTPQELAYLQAACDIACRAYERILKDVRVGITEKELAANLSRYMVLEGADTQPYGNILISGAKTSMLHGIPTEKPVEYGDLVLMDFGCQFHGYMSDMTRTVVVGRPTAKQKEVYDLVRRMNEAQEAAMKADVVSAEVFAASKALVAGTEYEPYFYTGIGHGIGLYVHEIPFVRPNGTDVLYENTVMTCEPGIYIPGWGGIRIEDQLHVTKDGARNMIWASKELIEL